MIVPSWRQFKRGKPELTAGAVLTILGVLGFLVLCVWGSPTTSPDPYTAFTTHGFATAVSAILLAGTLTVGIVLLVIGVILRLVQRATHRD